MSNCTVMTPYKSLSEMAALNIDEDIHGNVDYDFFDENGSNNNHTVNSETLLKQKSSEREDGYEDDFEDSESDAGENSNDLESDVITATKNMSLSIDKQKDNLYCHDSDVNLDERIHNSLENVDDSLKETIEGCSEDYNPNFCATSKLLENEFMEKNNFNDKHNHCCNKPSVSTGNSKNISKKYNNSSKKELRKDLMNTIAYQSLESNEGNIDKEMPDFDRSVSSDTTSDITDVTPCPSTSGCFSLSQCELTEPSLEDRRTKKTLNKRGSRHPPSSLSNPSSSLKLLKEAVSSMEYDQDKRGKRKTFGSKKASRINMSFSNDKLLKIDRDNRVLGDKLRNYKSSKPRPVKIPTYRTQTSSSAINRKRENERIQNENMMLVKKLGNVKGVVNSYWNSFPLGKK